MGIAVGMFWDHGNRTELSERRRWSRVAVKLSLKVGPTLGLASKP
jgi:hypothetical protein